MIYAKDLASMAVFYGVTLGLKVKARTETWVAFDEGVALHAIPPHLAAEIEIVTPPVAREQTPMKLVFTVSDVAAEGARLRSLGAVVVERPWGGCDVIDPEGNIIGLTTYAE